jgi:hypothetical protein
MEESGYLLIEKIANVKTKEKAKRNKALLYSFTKNPSWKRLSKGISEGLGNDEFRKKCILGQTRANKRTRFASISPAKPPSFFKKALFFVVCSSPIYSHPRNEGLKYLRKE